MGRPKNLEDKGRHEGDILSIVSINPNAPARKKYRVESWEWYSPVFEEEYRWCRVRKDIHGVEPVKYFKYLASAVEYQYKALSFAAYLKAKVKDVTMHETAWTSIN